MAPSHGDRYVSFSNFLLNNIQRILFVTQVNALVSFEPNQRTSRRSVGGLRLLEKSRRSQRRKLITRGQWFVVMLHKLIYPDD